MGGPSLTDPLLASALCFVMEASGANRRTLRNASTVPSSRTSMGTLVPTEVPRWKQALVYLRIVMGLSLFSIAGNLLRIKMGSSLAEFQDRQHLGDVGNPFPDFAANLLGCFVIGLAFQTKDRYWESVLPGSSTFKDWCHSSSVYVGIATWFCGSLTTYSAWNTGTALWAVSTAFLGASTAYVALLFGMDVGSGFQRVVDPAVAAAGQDQPPQQRDAEDGHEDVVELELASSSEGQREAKAAMEGRAGPASSASIPVGSGQSGQTGGWDPVVSDLVLYCVLGAGMVLLVYYQSDKEEVAYSCLFAPLGTMLRWGLALHLPKLLPPPPAPKKQGSSTSSWTAGLPLHTFAANLLGSILSALFRVATLEAHLRGLKRAEMLYKALSLGLCGCLSTYSTLCLEVFRLPSTAHAYRYMALTFMASQAASLLIMGIYQHVGQGGFP